MYFSIMPIYKIMSKYCKSKKIYLLPKKKKAIPQRITLIYCLLLVISPTRFYCVFFENPTQFYITIILIRNKISCNDISTDCTNRRHRAQTHLTVHTQRLLIIQHVNNHNTRQQEKSCLLDSKLREHVSFSLAKISMVAEQFLMIHSCMISCSLAKISMVAEHIKTIQKSFNSCSLAKISMVAERACPHSRTSPCCSLAKISMVAERKAGYG